MFGARNDEGWRLCWRKGRTIFYVSEKLYPDVIVEFQSQAKAKACADALNEHWKPYFAKEEKGQPVDNDLFWKFIDILVEFNGIGLVDKAAIRKILDAS